MVEWTPNSVVVAGLDPLPHPMAYGYHCLSWADILLLATIQLLPHAAIKSMGCLSNFSHHMHSVDYSWL